jgi:hypothetical protein
MLQFAGLNVGRMLARHLAPVKNATDGNTADDSKTLTHFRDSYTFYYVAGRLGSLRRNPPRLNAAMGFEFRGLALYRFRPVDVKSRSYSPTKTRS